MKKQRKTEGKGRSAPRYYPPLDSSTIFIHSVFQSHPVLSSTRPSFMLLSTPQSLTGKAYRGITIRFISISSEHLPISSQRSTYLTVVNRPARKCRSAPHDMFAVFAARKAAKPIAGATHDREVCFSLRPTLNRHIQRDPSLESTADGAPLPRDQWAGLHSAVVVR